MRDASVPDSGEGGQADCHVETYRDCGCMLARETNLSFTFLSARSSDLRAEATSAPGPSRRRGPRRGRVREANLAAAPLHGRPLAGAGRVVAQQHAGAVSRRGVWQAGGAARGQLSDARSSPPPKAAGQFMRR